jgi:hypothetical protein
VPRNQVKANRCLNVRVYLKRTTRTVALRFLVPGEPAFLLTLIPIGVGVVLILAPLLGRRR